MELLFQRKINLILIKIWEKKKFSFTKFSVDMFNKKDQKEDAKIKIFLRTVYVKVLFGMWISELMLLESIERFWKKIFKFVVGMKVDWVLFRCRELKRNEEYKQNNVTYSLTMYWSVCTPIFVSNLLIFNWFSQQSLPFSKVHRQLNENINPIQSLSSSQ